jgi:uroporphyrinogen decarboxylase
MTSKERVERAFRHEEADRVPVYEQTVATRIASEIMGRKMRTGGGRIRWEETSARWDSEEAWQDYVGHLVEDVGDLIRELGFDIVGLPWRHSQRPAAKLDDHTFRYEDQEDGLWSIFHYDEGSDVFDQVDSATKREGIPAIERLVRGAERGAEQARAPGAEDFGPLLSVARRAGGQRCLRSGQGFLMIPAEAPWLEACAERPDLVERYLDAETAHALAAIPALPEFGIKILWAGGDLASTGGPMYSPAMFRRFILPRLQKITRAAHEAGLVYLFRTDGNIWPIAQGLLVDSGVDGYGEIDVDAGMDPVELKRSFPHLTLWGGMSCGSTLVFDTPEGVREKARAVIGACAPGGGFIFGSSNSIHNGIPTENFLAMQEAAREFGQYGG